MEDAFGIVLIVVVGLSAVVAVGTLLTSVGELDALVGVRYER